jgi:serine phosphatase RsbU (regulator of sigma subunit)/CRP-like cAMP-binding protein
MPNDSPATRSFATALGPFAREEASLRVWSEHLERIVLADGDVLFRQDEPADSMFFIESGEVAVLLEIEGASRSHVRKFGAGQCLGEIAFYRHLIRTATVEAVGAAVLWRLTAANLARLEQQHPALALAFHRHVASLLAERVSFSNVELKEPLARLAHALRGLATSDFSGDGWDRPGVSEAAERDDEVGSVAQAMEFLVARLQEHIAALRQETAAREAIESELRIAGQIQLSLLPPALNAAEKKRVDFAAFIQPAREAGGDLYDGFFLPDGRFFTLVGDVSGKGVSAAVFMALAAMAVRTLARKVDDPGELLAQVNRLLCERNETMQFVTACAAMFDPASGELTWANSGHPLAAVVSAEGGIDWLEGPRAAPLGVFEDTTFTTQRRVLAANETLLVYSDGVSEAMDTQSALFGSEGIQHCLRGVSLNSSEDVVKRIVAAVLVHQADAPQADDLTLVALRPAR